jgi:kanamycin nucleotidyltransferase
MLLEPKPTQRIERLNLAEQIVQRILAVRGKQVLAIGLYGSLARGTDQLYSDIEMKCVLNTEEEDYSLEWIENGCKIEVNFESEDVILNEAATVDEDWAITHGAYFDLKRLYGSHDFFIKLQNTLKSLPQELFVDAIREIIIGNIYEDIGKLRNSRLAGNMGYLPLLACSIVEQGALAIGLAHKKCYSTRALVLKESLEFDNRPHGYEKLCQMVMGANLNDFDTITTTLEMFWVGLVEWAFEKGFNLEKRCIAPL